MIVEVDGGAVIYHVGVFDPDGYEEDVNQILGDDCPDWEPTASDMEAVGERVGELLDGTDIEDALQEAVAPYIDSVLPRAVMDVYEKRNG